MRDIPLLLEQYRPGSRGWANAEVFRESSHGAELWTDASGDRLIIKRYPNTRPSMLPSVVTRIDRLRRAGVPAPATDAGFGSDGPVLIQEYLPGRCGARISRSMTDHLLAIVELEAGLADDSAAEWADLIRRSLMFGLDGYCEHASLRAHSADSSALLQRIVTIGHEARGIELPAPDLVHFDLHPNNVLTRDGSDVSGIIDWDGVRAGDRAFDLGLLAFASSWAPTDPDALHQLWRAFLDASTHDARVVYMHHVTLRFVDWTIRHRTPPGEQKILDLSWWALMITDRGEFAPLPPEGRRR